MNPAYSSRCCSSLNDILRLEYLSVNNVQKRSALGVTFLGQQSRWHLSHAPEVFMMVNGHTDSIKFVKMCGHLLNSNSHSLMLNLEGDLMALNKNKQILSYRVKIFYCIISSAVEQLLQGV